MFKHMICEGTILIAVFISAELFVLGNILGANQTSISDNKLYHVELSMSSSPVIFGQTVELACATEFNTTNDLSRTWVLKENDVTICVNGQCNDSNKYSDLKTNVSTCMYILRIKNFSMLDVNKWYKCFIGNISDELPVYLNEQNYEYHPNESEVTINTERKDGYLNVEIVFEKVFPSPVCSLTFHNIDLSSAVNTIKWKNGLFYSVEMVIKDHFVGYTAAILNVNCKFGKSDIHVVSQDFPEIGNSELMSDEANSEANKIIAVIIANALLMLVGIVLYICAERHCTNVCTKKTSAQTYYEFEDSSTISSSQQEL
ncbi:Hypothetical predicted protein [Mytilus galloprovincialis]|uniref:Ig-like domain-containing protein n=1 Tax=Mytilus galloprovincialis TaxID=29158 RepID=A0A8B6C0I4_MYTGA|nr:Hypothetical predicted protein [Mytilus galloprovincialis]